MESNEENSDQESYQNFCLTMENILEVDSKYVQKLKDLDDAQADILSRIELLYEDMVQTSASVPLLPMNVKNIVYNDEICCHSKSNYDRPGFVCTDNCSYLVEKSQYRTKKFELAKKEPYNSGSSTEVSDDGGQNTNNKYGILSSAKSKRVVVHDSYFDVDQTAYYYNGNNFSSQNTTQNRSKSGCGRPSSSGCHKKYTSHNCIQKIEESTHTQRQFNRPIPDHIYFPLYEKLTQDEQQKKHERIEKAANKLVNMVKPFNFTLKNRDAKCAKSVSIADDSGENVSLYFRARPMPKHIYSEKIRQKMKAQEEYRKMQAKCRAEEMARLSYLPFTSSRSMYRASSCSSLPVQGQKIHLEINPAKPTRAKSALNLSMQRKRTTTCMPFELQTSNLETTKEKVLEDIKKDEETMLENRWPYKSPRSRVAWCHTNAINVPQTAKVDVKLNNSAQLRITNTKNAIEQDEKRENEKWIQKVKLKRKEEQLQRELGWRLFQGSGVIYCRGMMKAKVKTLKETDSTRQKEYKAELNDIERRVSEKPLLVERQSMNGLKQKIDKSYNERLSQNGLNASFVEEKYQNWLQNGGNCSTENKTDCADEKEGLHSSLSVESVSESDDESNGS